MMPPTLGNGMICYLVSALDVRRSVDFYHGVFGWSIRRRGDGSTAFDDGVGQVSGTWVLAVGSEALPSRTQMTRRSVDSTRAEASADAPLAFPTG